LIKDNKSLKALDGQSFSRIQDITAVGYNEFDDWNESRDRETQALGRKSYLPDELEDFNYELEKYGEWVYVPPYGNVWIPRGVSDSYWRPYFHGRWVHIGLCGWTWLPYEPWGWVTFHYGRWHYSRMHGWFWIPKTGWGPAWVHWYWGHDYWAWVPLNYYGYAGVNIANLNVYMGEEDIPPYLWSGTVIHKDQLKAKDISKVALSRAQMKKIGKMKLSEKAPPLHPSKTVALEKIGGDRIILRKKEAGIDPEGKNIRSRSIDRIRRGPETSSVSQREKGISSLSGERRIDKTKYYPSRSIIRSKSIRTSKSTRKSKMRVLQDRIWRHISGDDSRSSRRKLSSGNSSKSRISSRKSGSGSSSRGRVTSSSSRRSSSSSKSSGKTKKK
jgi:hypothetical protein